MILTFFFASQRKSFVIFREELCNFFKINVYKKLKKIVIYFKKWTIKMQTENAKKIDFLKSDLFYNTLRLHIALKISYDINKISLRIFLHNFGMFYIKTYQIPMLLSE